MFSSMNDFEINIVIILLVGAMTWILFGALDISVVLAVAILIGWMILIGYVGGKIASK